MLPRVADRPEHLDVHDARRLAEADVLLQRRGAEAAPAVHRAIDRSLCAGVLDCDLDARANRRAIRLDTHQTHTQPVVAVPGIFEQTKDVRVARSRAADLEDDLLVAVVVEIREGDAVTFVHLAGP